jgi:putative nucleotidyltransferase with HDIG domain
VTGFFAWVWRVVPRTVVAFVPRLARPDDAYAQRLLPPCEYALYARMDARDRLHACKVAKALQAEGEVSEVLLRAALLHDVGKSVHPYRAWERIAFHLFVPRGLPASPALQGFRRAQQVHVHHAAYGAALIREAGGDARVAELVARHHDPGDDGEARRLARLERLF